MRQAENGSKYSDRIKNIVKTISMKNLLKSCQLFWEKAPGLNWEKYAVFWIIWGIFIEVKTVKQ